MELLEFAVDYDVLFDVLSLIVILSFFIERALAVFFESGFFINWCDPPFKAAENAAQDGPPNSGTDGDGAAPAPPVPPALAKRKKGGIKELIAIVLSITVVACYEFDALAIIMKDDCCTSKLGYFITGLIIAGGSKGSIKLFKDVLDFKSDAERRRKEFKKNSN